MPVKISANPAGETDVRAITLDEFETGRANFNEHYTSDQTGEVLGQIIPVSWMAFSQTILEYLNTNPTVTEAQVGVTFVHCYDQLEEVLYYKLKLSCMTPTAIQGEFSLQPPFMWFTIREHNIATCSDPGGNDEPYMNNLMYQSGPEASVEQLSEHAGIFVREMTFPWLTEIKQMFIQNGSPMNATFNMASCSYVDEGGGGAALVEWPHGMVMYLSVGSQDLIDNGYYVLPFNHRGADMGTVCPPICNAYVVPTNTISIKPSSSSIS
jgi:hypothetical protein